MATETRCSGFGRAGSLLKHEFLALVPVAIYFLVGFNLIVFTLHLALLQEGIVYDGMTKATVGALLVAKVVLVADRLPIAGFVRGRPLIGPILYRSALYTVLVFLAHLLEEAIGKAVDAGDVASGLAAARAEFLWEHALFVLLWVFVLFVFYMSEAELRRALDLPPMWRLLIERRGP